LLLPYRADDMNERNRVAAEFELAEARGNAARAADAGMDYFRGMRLPLLVASGQWEEARQIARFGGASQTAHYRDALASVDAELSRLQGESERAWRRIRDVWPAGPATEPGSASVYFTLTLQRLAVDLALDQRDFATARAWLTAYDRWLAWMGAILGLAEGKLLWSRLYRLSGDRQQAAAEARSALDLALNPRQPVALIQANRALGEIATADSRFDEASSFFEQSRALARACRLAFEEAQTMLAQAELCAKVGQTGESLRLIENGRRIALSLGAKPMLERADAIAAMATNPRGQLVPRGLSPREMEVLHLLADGHSNQEIAEALSLSVRTVERHLSNAYGKIGVQSRSAAISYLLQHANQTS
jgi:ATP/maltotriose-dependent transcriptional regulator MalT